MLHNDSELQDCRILVVDDNQANLAFLEQVLEVSGFRNVRTLSDGPETPGVFAEYHPDLLILDLHMPGMDGFEVLEQLRDVTSRFDFVPVLVFTADVASETRRRALSAGASDFLTKPGDVFEIKLRVCNFLRMRLLYKALRAANSELCEDVSRASLELQELHTELVERLALVAEYRDDDTGHHARRVGLVAGMIAEQLGMPPEEVEVVRTSALLHDIGKVGIPDTILLKPGLLTPDEIEVIRTHTTIGSKVLSGSQSAFLQAAETIARTHHERWDGKGYPNGLQGEEIPLLGRIVSVADVFDALRSKRTYKEAVSRDEAISIVRSESGKAFDPKVVEAFLAAIEQSDATGEELTTAA